MRYAIRFLTNGVSRMSVHRHTTVVNMYATHVDGSDNESLGSGFALGVYCTVISSAYHSIRTH